MFDAVFDLMFSGMMAFNQVGWMLGGLIFTALGGALLSNALYWRLKAMRVEGEIIGVREKKQGMYHNVYRYTLPTGESFEASSDTGSSLTGGRETGRRVALMVFPDKPDEVRESGGYLMGIFGAIFLAPGIWMFYMALTAYPVTPMTGLVAVGMIVMLVKKARRFLIPKAERLSVTDWKNKKMATRRAEVSSLPVRSMEEILSAPETIEKLEKQRKSARIAAPLLLLFAGGLIWGGLYLGQKMRVLENQGLRAPGEVVRLEESRSSDSTSYHPVVEFTDSTGNARSFRDSMGSNPPSYHRGEAVTVLYLAGAPEESATIDRGLWNWLVPFLLGGFGALLLFASFGLFRQMRQEEVR